MIGSIQRLALVCAAALFAVSLASPSIVSRQAACEPLLIDDWISQSRLTFLYYNALLKPSSDDATMTSIVVKNNRVTFTPKSTSSYFYSQFSCVSATNKYGGIGFRIKAPAGAKFDIEIQTRPNCVPDQPAPQDGTVSKYTTTAELGWTFEGNEEMFYLPFTAFSGLNTNRLVGIVVYAFTRPTTFGPMAFYCGTTGSEYYLPASTTASLPTNTQPATTSTVTGLPLVIDRFTNANNNTLGFWHGADNDSQIQYGSGRLTIRFSDSDYSFYTQLTGTCRDIRTYENAYLHIAYSGSNKFTVALQQHNAGCDESKAPYPETWDTVYAQRYSTSNNRDIYIPLSHFNINKQRTIGIALKGFASADPTVLTRIELVRTVPAGFSIPSKIPTAPLVFACTRPNSFAFAIDDGIPEFAQEVMQIIKDEGIKATFFTVGAALLDNSTNLANVYREMLAQGHQIALHSFTHPKMEGLGTREDIDWEIRQDVDAVKKTLGIESKYFRPPFGNEGARFRERLAANIPGVKLINWSVDVQDWLWGTNGSAEKQLDAFKADVAKGGNLVVLHYLYPSTVGYLREFIQLAKATGIRKAAHARGSMFGRPCRSSTVTRYLEHWKGQNNIESWNLALWGNTWDSITISHAQLPY